MPERESQLPSPAFVLIHGGAVSGRFWDLLVPHLRHPALAIDLPGRGDKPADPMAFTVDDGVRSVVEDVRAAGLADRDLVLVAHSSGGLFTPGVAAALAPRVRHIVLSAASVPPEGGCGLDCMKASHRERTVQAIEAARRDGWVLTTPGPPEDPEQSRTSYGVELSDELLAFVNDPVRNVKDSMNIYFQPVSWASVAEVPVTYLKNLRDRPVPVALQDEMIGRLPQVEVVELDTGHIPAITEPEAFARILDDIANAVSVRP
jgi:pimeloyl-ACP methyl ester carboxylesterase